MKEPRSISSLYEDNDFLVINKPAGLVVHSDGKRKEESVVDWIKAERPEVCEVGEPLRLSTGEMIERSGIVHRLDKETSGVLIIAKNQKAYEHLKSQFKNRSVEKIYNAFAQGSFKDESGEIDFPIGRSARDFRRRAVKGTRGETREALTLYKVLVNGREASFLEIFPKTGRNHQIRVHMKAVNHPIICDKLYSPKAQCILGFRRLALHARSIKFKDQSGDEINIEAPLPEDFEEALEKIKGLPN